MPENDATTKAFCNRCHGETTHRHARIHARTYTEGHGAHQRPLQESWDLLVCLGCESVRIRRTISCPEYARPDVTEFPPRQGRRTPPWQNDLPDSIRDMHREVYDTLQVGAPCCATMGARTLIDMVLTEVVGDQGNFRAKLDAAVQAGHLATEHRRTLEAAIDAGSAAAHRGFTPNEELIEDVLDIVEHLLQGRYILGPASDRLRNQVPPRPR